MALVIVLLILAVIWIVWIWALVDVVRQPPRHSSHRYCPKAPPSCCPSRGAGVVLPVRRCGSGARPNKLTHSGDLWRNGVKSARNYVFSRLDRVKLTPLRQRCAQRVNFH